MPTEEQNEELEVLKSIYDTRYSEVSNLPRRIRIDGITGEGVGLELEVEFTPMYPNELPIFSILVVSGRISDSEALRMWVREEAERSLGMAMIFSMVTAIEDWLAKQKKASGMGDTLTKEEKPLIQDDFVLTMRGGVVTIESFMAWNAKFLTEMEAGKRQAEQEKKEKEPLSRLTGRQLFEQNRSLITSDMNYTDANEAIVEVDIGAFEGLDDLDINDDEDQLDANYE